jgi:hypothetical protein
VGDIHSASAAPSDHVNFIGDFNILKKDIEILEKGFRRSGPESRIQLTI